MSSQSDQIPRLSLRPNESIPQLGFGVFQVPPRETEEVVARALDAGRRLAPDPDTFVRP
jgi:2,5-diketo-D-gluconate reductase A